ncbi:ArsR family transcriptional regulator [Nonomuraea ferruginea]
MASPARLHLMWLITHGSYDVSTLATHVGIGIATVSQHLAKLRLARPHHRTPGRPPDAVRGGGPPHVVTLIRQIFDHIAPPTGAWRPTLPGSRDPGLRAGTVAGEARHRRGLETTVGRTPEQSLPAEDFRPEPHRMPGPAARPAFTESPLESGRMRLF